MKHDNRALAIRWLEENWNTRNERIIDELLMPQTVGYMEGVEAKGPAGFREVKQGMLASFPDLRIEILAAVADGEVVAVRWRLRGTHKGAGPGALKATNRPVDVTGSTWFRFDGKGKILEGHDTWNQGAVLASLAA